MTHTDITKKLIGNIHPTGQSGLDKERLENLKEMCELVENLKSEIEDIAYRNKDSYESSVKEIGLYADNFLKNTLGIK